MIPRETLERWRALADALPAWTRTPNGDLQSPPQVHPQVLSDDELDALAEKVAIIVFAREAMPALLAEVESQAKEIERLRDVLACVVTIEQRRTYSTCPDCDTPDVCKRTMQCTVASDTEKLCRAALKEGT